MQEEALRRGPLTATPQRGQDRLERPLLVGGQRRRAVQAAPHGNRIRPGGPLEGAKRDQAAAFETAERGGAERGGQGRAAGVEPDQCVPLAIGEPLTPEQRGRSGLGELGDQDRLGWAGTESTGGARRQQERERPSRG